MACGGQEVPAAAPPEPAEPETIIITATSPPESAQPETLIITATPPPEAAEEAPAPEPTEEPVAEELPAPSVLVRPVTTNSEWAPQVQDFQEISMALVPTGCFQLGAIGAAATNAEQPEHEQCIDSPFWIAATEMTNSQAEATGFEFANRGEYAADNFPRDNVTWLEAKSSCEGLGMRLPTEVEWEWAANGPDNLAWPMGDIFRPGFVIWGGNASLATEVGKFREGASWVGAFDMAGNVREWTSTGQASYPYDASDGREDATESGTLLKITRGRSYASGGDFTRTSYRDWYQKDAFSADIGWRCVRDA